jgi:hypothetical protein
MGADPDRYWLCLTVRGRDLPRPLGGPYQSLAAATRAGRPGNGIRGEIHPAEPVEGAQVLPQWFVINADRQAVKVDDGEPPPDDPSDDES